MSGITFTVTGSSNDTNLVLSSANAAIHEGGEHDGHHEHDHLLHSDITELKTNVTLQTGRLNLLDLSVNLLSVVDPVTTYSHGPTFLSRAQASAATKYTFKNVTLPKILDNSLWSNISGNTDLPSTPFKYSDCSAMLNFPSALFSGLGNVTISGDFVANIGDGNTADDAVKTDINLIFPINYATDPVTTRYPLLVFLEGDGTKNLPPFGYMQSASGGYFWKAFKGTDLSNGAFAISIAPYNSTYRNNYFNNLTAISTPSEYDDQNAGQYIAMLKYEILPGLAVRYPRMKTGRDDIVLIGGSSTGSACIRTMLEYPEIAKRYIANSPTGLVGGIVGSRYILNTDRGNSDGNSIEVFNPLTGFTELKYLPENDPSGWKPNWSFYKNYFKTSVNEISALVNRSIRESSLALITAQKPTTLARAITSGYNSAVSSANALANANDCWIAITDSTGSANTLYEGYLNRGNAYGSSMQWNPDGTSIWTYFDAGTNWGTTKTATVPYLEEFGFKRAPCHDYEVGTPSSRLVGEHLKVFHTSWSKKYGDHSYFVRLDNMHEQLCKLYEVPDASWSHVDLNNTITYWPKTDFTAYNFISETKQNSTLTNLADSDLCGNYWSLYAYWNNANPLVWKTIYTILDPSNGNANVTSQYTTDSCGQIINMGRTAFQHPTAITATTDGRNTGSKKFMYGSNQDRVVSSSLKLDPTGKLLQVSFYGRPANLTSQLGSLLGTTITPLAITIVPSAVLFYPTSFTRYKIT